MWEVDATGPSEHIIEECISWSKRKNASTVDVINITKQCLKSALNILGPNFCFASHDVITFCRRSHCHLFTSSLLCITNPAGLVNVSLRFHTHVHVVVFSHQICGFVCLNVY